ncbi:TrmH family RNA methyltransferase [Boudabousia marimammalium]|uniref:RNA methyltransferase n=1 Tax=Boudabousia marimammalium TaxID=156892 RepID=A0A1Q5PKJ0_9ACTO|nr:RNA methyltransferase [Boudabousia marimammalium]OKL46735.1 RNA methyltransferase [Boudabousia marimammalium]
MDNPTESAEEVGVGPWPGGPENWPDDPKYDRQLLAEGDRRNVLDQYRYWTLEAIVADLDEHRRGFHIAIENVDHDFNIGSIVRTANAMGASSVHIVGRRRWNRRGAMVTDRYMHVTHHESPEQFGQWCKEVGVPVIGIDNVPGSVPLEGETLPPRAMLVFGSEASGLSEQMQALCENICFITQHGSTRSMNVGHAAAIAMWAWNQAEDSRRA